MDRQSREGRREIESREPKMKGKRRSYEGRGKGETRVSLLEFLLEELALGCARISHNAHVDIATEMSTLRGCLGNTSKQHQQNTTLHLIITCNMCRRIRSSD